MIPLAVGVKAYLLIYFCCSSWIGSYFSVNLVKKKISFFQKLLLVANQLQGSTFLFEINSEDIGTVKVLAMFM